jgi:hypothetical protein
MAETKVERVTVWSVCPIEDCPYALEYDPEESYFCPICEMEMIHNCSCCGAPIIEEEPTLCGSCGGRVKE